jgi:hypothetical protein
MAAVCTCTAEDTGGKHWNGCPLSVADVPLANIEVPWRLIPAGFYNGDVIKIKFLVTAGSYSTSVVAQIMSYIPGESVSLHILAPDEQPKVW